MKFIIFACLLIYLHCSDNFRIRNMDKYGSIIHFGMGEGGIIALDLSLFSKGDTIYLTFVYFNENSRQPLNYDFSNDNKKDIHLNRTIYSYSTSEGYLDDIFGHYYDYYYKIKIPTNEPKAHYLLMRYDISHDTRRVMNVYNTKFARYTSLIISFSFFGIIILTILILFLFKHRINLNITLLHL